MQITIPKEEYTFDYPEAIEFAETQQSIFWTADEIDVEKDVQDIKVHMTESESHGVISTLKLFTLYELIAGGEYWGDTVMRAFPRPDIQRMANCFSFFELNVHAPFYNKLNQVLGLDTDEFFSSYKEDKDLTERIDFINSVVDDFQDDPLVSLAVFSMVEGVVLYSSFAFLKHFQAQGKNLLNNVVAGINFSVRDENLHSEGGAWLFRTLLKEMKEAKDRLLVDKGYSYEKNTVPIIIKLAEHIYEHECLIIQKLFEKGPIKGITEHQLECFVQHRINHCLKNLDIEPIYEITYNPISSWFYKNINSVQFHDFFNRTGNEYNRNWKEENFTW